jgi:hypothetical protein
MRRSIVRFFAAPMAAVVLVAMLAIPAFADPRDFEVVNNSSIILTHVYVSPSNTLAWGDDILGRDILSPTETVNVSFAGFDGNSCLYDVKVTGLEGQEGVLYQVDLCTVFTVSFSDQPAA